MLNFRYSFRVDIRLKDLLAENRPSFSMLRRMYGIFNRKYKKNMKDMYIVNPVRELAVIFACVGV